MCFDIGSQHRQALGVPTKTRLHTPNQNTSPYAQPKHVSIRPTKTRLHTPNQNTSPYAQPKHVSIRPTKTRLHTPKAVTYHESTRLL